MKFSTDIMINQFQFKENSAGGGGTNTPPRPITTAPCIAGMSPSPVVGSSITMLRGRGPPNVKVKRKCIEVVCEPCIIFLVTTILVTALASALLSMALTSRYWEMMIYDTDKLRRLVENRTHLSVEWLYNGRVPRINGTTGGISTPRIYQTSSKSSNSSLGNFRDSRLLSHQKFIKNQHSTTFQEANTHHQEVSTDSGNDNDDSMGNLIHSHQEPTFVFLVPLHSGVWVSCIDLTEPEFDDLKEEGYGNYSHCVDHLNPDLPRPTETRAAWQHRMQNLAIACALVCLILLGAAIVVGLFGILRRQISAVLVTGVIYVLAALFALFTLAIVHLKHKNRHESDPLDVWTRLTPDYTEFRSARIISHGWSLQLAWAGTFVCVLASVMWILLSKIMRYNPISFLP